MFKTLTEGILKHKKIALIFIVSLGFCLRIMLFTQISNQLDYSKYAFMDEINYLQLAENLHDFKEYSAFAENFQTQATRSPIYPAVLSLFHFTGEPYFYGLLFNCLLDTLNIFLIFCVLWRMSGFLAGFFGGFCYSIWGTSFNYIAQCTPEIWTLFVALISLLIILYINVKPFLKLFAFIVAYGILIHSRPAFLLMTPFVIIVIFFLLYGERKRRFYLAMLTFIGIALFCLPWGIRNYQKFQTIVPISTIAGWHIFTSSEANAELSINTLTDYVYRPQNKNFNEGDYFKESLELSKKAFLEKPIESFFMGFARIAYRWGFGNSFRRIFQPKSYVYPVYLSPHFFLPLLDFEGFVYLTFLGVLCCVIRGGKSFIAKLFTSIKKNILLWSFILFYTLVHCLSVPMIQYRFILEPFILIAVFATMATYIGREFISVENEKESFLRLYFPFIICDIMMIYGFCYVFFYGHAKSIKYERASKDYSIIRQEQWQNLGNIQTTKTFKLTGQIKYISDGFIFKKNQSIAERAKGKVCKLFIDKYAESSLLGIGDAILNLPKNAKFNENDFVEIQGTCNTTRYKGLLINVEKIRKINTTR